jgi:hypothetical protein
MYTRDIYAPSLHAKNDFLPKIVKDFCTDRARIKMDPFLPGHSLPIPIPPRSPRRKNLENYPIVVLTRPAKKTAFDFMDLVEPVVVGTPSNIQRPVTPLPFLGTPIQGLDYHCAWNPKPLGKKSIHCGAFCAKFDKNPFLGGTPVDTQLSHIYTTSGRVVPSSI